MATAAQISTVRSYTDEPDATGGFSDQLIGDLVDQYSSTDRAAAEVWLQKAAKYASAVDISEGGSSRKNSELHANAIRMSNMFLERANAATSSAGRVGTRISKLTRS